MAERKPHLPEVVVCEVGKNVNANRVPSKRALVLRQPDASWSDSNRPPPFSRIPLFQTTTSYEEHESEQTAWAWQS